MAIQNSALKITITAIFVAIALVTNYSLIWLPQVKLMDAIIFLIAYYFGLQYGIGAAVLTRLIYGVINPYGFDFYSLLMVISGELFFVLLAGIFRKLVKPEELFANKANLFLLSFFAILATFLFDLYTNALVGLIWYRSIMLGLVMGVPFGLMHQIANLFITPVLVPAAVYLFQRFGV
ncbi:MAG TPA: ECF transporter S component [Geobacterales bacterium]|nr:ECF transporter S component [Geobacterales bacterium]